MLIAYRVGDHALFLCGFAKNGRENINADTLAALREIGAAWLAADADGIADALDEDLLQKGYDDGES